jgi:hypothetical protein
MRTFTPQTTQTMATAYKLLCCILFLMFVSNVNVKAVGFYVGAGTTVSVDGDMRVGGDNTEIDGTLQLQTAGTVFSTAGLTVDGDIAGAGHDDATVRISSGTLTGTANPVVIPNKLDVTGNITMAQNVDVNNVVSVGANKITLGGKTLKLTQSATGAITYAAGGGVQAENSNFNSILSWNMGTTAGTFNMPFVKSDGTDVKIVVTTSGTDVGYIGASTYASSDDNTPRPAGVNHVSGVSNKTTDRYAYLTRSAGTGTPAPDITFTYATPEAPSNGAETDMRLQDYNTGTNVWNAAAGGQSNDIVANTVSITSFSLFSKNIAFSNGGGSLGAAPLPVELSKFEAECNDGQVNIVWETASEINNKGFQIERSLDGFNNYAIIAEQLLSDNEGNSTTPKSYMDIDAAPFAGTSYYRLKQMDQNGAYEYHGPVSVNCGSASGLDINSAIHNQEEQTVVLNFNAEEDEIVYYTLIDYRGQRVAEQEVNAKAGGNQVNISTIGVNKGIYMLSIKNKYKTITDKIVIQ